MIISQLGEGMVIVTDEMQFARDVSNHMIFMDQGVIVEEAIRYSLRQVQ